MRIAEVEPSSHRAVVAPRVLVGQSADGAWMSEEIERRLGRETRKRITALAEGGEEGRLVDRVEMMLRRGVGGEFNLYGAPGSGKTTAIAELARVFGDEERLKLVDDGRIVKPQTPRTQLMIFTTDRRDRISSAMELAPWGRDEWIEYMLGRWRKRCHSVMGRVLKDRFEYWLRGIPQLWAAALDEMAAGDDSLDLRTALRRRVARVAISSQRHAEGAALCARLLTRQLAEGQFRASFLAHEQDFSRLLRHRAVQVLLASDMVAYGLCDLGDTSALDGMWPRELIEETALRLRERNGMVEILQSVLEREDPRPHPVTASLLLALEPAWRPSPRYVPNLCSAHLAKAQWQHVDLFGARLVGTDLHSANLRFARLLKANATNARMSGADLRQALLEGIDAENANLSFANMVEVQASYANFAHANLQGTNLHEAMLYKASFVGATLNDAQLCRADLRRANFCNAKLEGADFANADLSRAVFKNPKLQETNLSGARLHKARLMGCDMEEMDLRGMDLSGAVLGGGLLTGACLAGANLRKADLQNTGLAEIELEGADLRRANLRGASFHLGSTRAGLVGSVIPCEGSRTGFYTDEREEQSFKRPEEIRKANLSRADLRGAKIKGVDFYLVDVRGAKYTRRQGKYMKRCGAIMT